MKQSILAVDDEPHLLRLLERIITHKTSYRIIITNSSLEVPKILENNQFDLMLVDLKMPGLNGMDILRMVNEQDRQEKVIIITAFGSLDTAIKAFQLGAVDYIMKPFKQERIISSVERWMYFQRATRKLEELDAIFTKEPFSEALQEFRNEYLRRKFSKYGNNIEKIMKETGISGEDIDNFTKNRNL